MIRLFQEKDAEACSSIMLQCIDKFDNYTKDNQDFLISVSQPDKIIEKSKKLNFFVFENDGKILGTGAFDNGEIRTMFINPEYQGKGIGSKILNFLISFAKSKGYRKVFLGANPEAEVFYEKNGFRKIKERVEFDFKTIDMEKDI